MSDQPKKTGIHLRNYVRYMVADYVPLNKPYTLTIKWVTETDWYNKKSRQFEKCASLVFEETPAELKLTSHDNCRTLARLWGESADAWIGKRIVIKAMESDFGDGGGSKKRTIRIVGEGKPPATLPVEKVAPTKTALDKLWDLAAQREISKEEVEMLLSDAGGDAAAALESLAARYNSAQEVTQ